MVSAIALTGCATTKDSSSLSNLQFKVAQLERKLEQKDNEITELKYQIKEMAGQDDEADSGGFYISDSVEEPQITRRPAATVSSSFKDDGEIIRVSASPRDVQSALKKAGYYTGNIDGKIGDKTKKAIEDFQRDHMLNVDGIIGKNTWTELKNYIE